ncbi:hypothetical protein FISHEDRAFT_53583 [Fistulina hepatica ATCC 64428]|nr:hypothetical protein FISHEDRAFT_53583 [Fistulina hepatica ATCC 64428]
MSGSPPDISTLTISSPQRLHDTYDYDSNVPTRSPYHFATTTGIPQQQQMQNMKSAVRGGLPTQWLDSVPDNRSLSPQNNSDFSSAGGSPPPMGHIQPPPSAPSPADQGIDDEIIPTAIVIKNIPFNVKREQLLDIIASLSIPTPYAFNYHLDQQGSFRGLAFANFRQAQDADAVVAALNGFDVQGRKLRVEYKKVLQAGEKERIEREKAIRRMRSMQLQKEESAAAAAVNVPLYDEYGAPIPPVSYGQQRTFSSGSYSQQPSQYSPPSVPPMPTPPYSHTLSSAPAATQVPMSSSASDRGPAELDLNDAATLEIYSRILLFRDDRMRDELAFSRNLTPKQRRVVHLLAQRLGVYHYSIGEGDERYVVVTRIDPQRQQQPQRTLNRVPSAYLTPTVTQTSIAQSLRTKKSMPDMKTLHSQASRTLTTRASNGNIREGYATISSPSRRPSAGFSSLFSSNGFGSNVVPPVPALPASLTSPPLNGGHDSPAGVVRQPRGPGVGGFARRDSRVSGADGQTRGGLEARTYEPLEI